MTNYSVPKNRALVPVKEFPYNDPPAKPIRITSFTNIRLGIVGFILLLVGFGILYLHEENKHRQNFPQTISSIIFATDTIFKIDTVTLEKVVYSSPLRDVVISKEEFTKQVGVSPLKFALIHTADVEGFRGTPYPDGQYHSVGFGWNLSPDHVKVASKILGRNMSLDALKKKPLTKKEAYELLSYKLRNLMFIYESSFPSLKNNAYLLVACTIKGYARGKNHLKKNKIYACCDGKVGCGSKNPRIRASHNSRRLVEAIIISGDVSSIKEIYKHHVRSLKGEGLSDILTYAKNL